MICYVGQADPFCKATLNHSESFWSRRDTPANQKEGELKGLNALGSIA